MVRTRTARIAATLAATLALGLLAVVTGSTHEQDQAPPARGPDSGAGPERGARVEMPARSVGLEIDLRLGQTYDGEVTVSEGRVASLEVIWGGGGTRIDGGRFHVASKKAAAKKKKERQKKKQAGAAAPVLLAVLDAPETAAVTVRTSQGEFTFRLADAPAGKRLSFLDARAFVERRAASVRLTGRGTEDDYPAAAVGLDGHVWLAHVEYHPETPRLPGPPTPGRFDELVPTRNGDVVRLRRFDGSAWLPALDVTEGGLDVWRPTVAVDGQGGVWVAWAEQIEGDWEARARRFDPQAGKWANPVRLGPSKGSDFHVVATTDAKGTVWFAWQSFRDGRYQIVAEALEGGRPPESPRVVSNGTGDAWSPAIAADRTGRVFVAWDTYDRGNFDVLVRDATGDGPAVSVASTPRYEARASLACDPSGRLWVAYEEGDEQWGKDYASAKGFRKSGLEKNPGNALYVSRRVKVKCLVEGRLLEPAGGTVPPSGALGGRKRSFPRLAVAADGALWLVARHHPLTFGGEVWLSAAQRFDGQGWSDPEVLTNSANLLDNRPALAPTPSGLLVVHSTDRRQSTAGRGENDLYATRLAPATGQPPKGPELVPSKVEATVALAPVHPSEAADIARLRAYRVEIGGKTLRPLRGEFHRHTEFSAHHDGDGSLEDSWRYGLDAADLDWMGNADHDNGAGSEYMWWLIQKSADLHHNPPRFVGAHTYERSTDYPNGHRNVMMPRRGIRPLPRGVLQGTEEAGTPDTKLLYQYLKHFGGICASHTSATNMGTDWRDNDPEVEPVVEIYQGHRHNYERPGAPRSPTAATEIGGFQPKGFIDNALAKGYRLGFESSSDHTSTHLSYAIVYVEDTGRQAVIDAFKARHCYAATDNIVLDVRSGARFMGDAFVAAGKPTLDVVVKGTAPVANVHVIRDDQHVFSTSPNQREVTLRYTDDDARPGVHYYYVRVEQADGNLAWASPMWITLGK